MPASGCCSKDAASSGLELLDAAVDLADLPDEPHGYSRRTPGSLRPAPRAAGSAAHRGPRRRAARGCSWRPPRRRAQSGFGTCSAALASRGPLARVSTPTASPWARLGKASSAAGKYSLRALRSRLVWRVRSQTSCWWARARMRTAPASSLSPATCRWLCAVGAHQVGEQLGVAGVGLGAADVVAVGGSATPSAG